MKRHNLKTWPEFYQAILEGRKKFELRKDDRGFNVGDILVLREFNPETEKYSGREMEVTVTYIAKGIFGMTVDQVIMSIDSGETKEVSKKRHIAKTFTWRIIATLTTFFISLLMTGSIEISVAIMSIEFFVKMGLYYGHERIWYKSNFGIKHKRKK